MSRIGKQPISIPDKVTVSVAGDVVNVEGPKGKASYKLPPEIGASLDGGHLNIENKSTSRQGKAFHGLARTLVANHIEGVSSGFSKKLEIQGVGFKAALDDKTLNLNLGFSHQIHYAVPEGITITVEEQTKIKVEGTDKQKVGAVAADIRSYYPPEPYKGKGVRYEGEYVRRKEGKTAQGK